MTVSLQGPAIFRGLWPFRHKVLPYYSIQRLLASSLIEGETELSVLWSCQVIHVKAATYASNENRSKWINCCTYEKPSSIADIEMRMISNPSSQPISHILQCGQITSPKQFHCCSSSSHCTYTPRWLIWDVWFLLLFVTWIVTSSKGIPSFLECRSYMIDLETLLLLASIKLSKDVRPKLQLLQLTESWQ